MNIKRYYNLIEKDAIPLKTEVTRLKRVIEENPSFQSAIFLYLKSLYKYDIDNYSDELQRLSIYVCDRKALFYYVLSEEYLQFTTATGKEQLSDDRTHVLLQAFFSKNEDIETPYFEYESPNATLASIDYISFLEKENTKPILPKNKKSKPLKHQNIIDTFIQKSDENAIHIPMIKEDEIVGQIEMDANPMDEDASAELNEDLFFTETLSKIYIKQKKYDKAYKIIQHLSLTFPKKNAYFADQLKYIEKLIINSQYKK